MKKKPKNTVRPMTDEEGEVRLLTREEVASMRPFVEVFPELSGWVEKQTAKRKAGQRGPGKIPAKRQISIRLDVDVLDHYRATGPGWQKRINEDLRSKAKL